MIISTSLHAVLHILPTVGISLSNIIVYSSRREVVLFMPYGFLVQMEACTDRVRVGYIDGFVILQFIACLLYFDRCQFVTSTVSQLQQAAHSLSASLC